MTGSQGVTQRLNMSEENIIECQKNKQEAELHCVINQKSISTLQTQTQ